MNDKIKRYSGPTGRRHVQLRAFLHWLEDIDEPQSSTDIAEQFKWQYSNAKRNISTMLEHRLIKVARKELGPNKLERHFYVAAEYDDYTLDLLLPIDVEAAKRAGFSVGLNTRALSESNPVRRSVAVVARDPLDLLLMGSGRAPSLLFAEQRQ